MSLCVHLYSETIEYNNWFWSRYTHSVYPYKYKDTFPQNCNYSFGASIWKVSFTYMYLKRRLDIWMLWKRMTTIFNFYCFFQMGDWFLFYMLGQNVDSIIFKDSSQIHLLTLTPDFNTAIALVNCGLVKVIQFTWLFFHTNTHNYVDNFFQ